MPFYEGCVLSLAGNLDFDQEKLLDISHYLNVVSAHFHLKIQITLQMISRSFGKYNEFSFVFIELQFVGFDKSD